MNVKRVIVAYTSLADNELLRIIRALDGQAHVQVVPRLYELVQARGIELGRIALLDAGGLAPSIGQRRLKRAFDLVLASLMLLLLAPLLVAIGLVVKLDTHGSVALSPAQSGQELRGVRRTEVPHDG